MNALIVLVIENSLWMNLERFSSVVASEEFCWPQCFSYSLKRWCVDVHDKDEGFQGYERSKCIVPLGEFQVIQADLNSRRSW